MKINFIESLILDAVSKIDNSLNPRIILEKPRNETHGDISCNIAMQLASNLKDKPINISKTILENLDNPDSKYYVRTQAVADLQNVLQKYGFKSSEEAGYIASRKQRDKTIGIKDYGYDTGSEHGFEQIEDDDELELNIELIYPDGKKRTGWIPISKLKNYID